MISLFQQLFMVPSFRDDLLAVDDPNHDDQPPDENMFSNSKRSSPGSSSPRSST